MCRLGLEQFFVLGILAVGSFLADFGSSLTHPVDFALGRLDLTCVCLSSSLGL